MVPRVPPKMRRPAMVEPRPVRADQRVGLERRLVGLAEVGQARRAGLLAGLDQDRRVEAERAALLEHAGQRRDVDGVLALVVGRAAAIHLLAFDHDLPRRQALPPLVLLAADHVAMTVGQHRRLASRPRPGGRSGTARIRRADWAARCSRSRACCSDSAHLARDVLLQRGHRALLLAGGGDGDPALQVVQEAAGRRNISLRARWRRRVCLSWASKLATAAAKEPTEERMTQAGPGGLQPAWKRCSYGKPAAETRGRAGQAPAAPSACS